MKKLIHPYYIVALSWLFTSVSHGALVKHEPIPQTLTVIAPNAEPVEVLEAFTGNQAWEGALLTEELYQWLSTTTPPLKSWSDFMDSLHLTRISREDPMRKAFKEMVLHKPALLLYLAHEYFGGNQQRLVATLAPFLKRYGKDTPKHRLRSKWLVSGYLRNKWHVSLPDNLAQRIAAQYLDVDFLHIDPKSLEKWANHYPRAVFKDELFKLVVQPVYQLPLGDIYVSTKQMWRFYNGELMFEETFIKAWGVVSLCCVALDTTLLLTKYPPSGYGGWLLLPIALDVWNAFLLLGGLPQGMEETPFLYPRNPVCALRTFQVSASFNIVLPLLILWQRWFGK